VLATAIWGGTFVAIRDTVRTLDPGVLVLARFACAAIVLAPFVVVRRLAPRAWWGAALSGLAAAGGYLFQAIGLTQTSAGSSAFLTCAGTAFAAPLAWALLRQRPGRAVVTGLVIALAGSALLSVGPARAGGAGIGRGELWTLLGAVCFALQILVLARIAPRADPLALAGVQAIAMTLAFAPFAHHVRAALAALDAAGWWRFAYLALPASVVAPWLQIVSQRRLPAARIALLFALEPVFALAFALLLGGERFAVPWYAGAALILLGVVWGETAP
ncbi:MAG TPA: DMT family transporter, partial [Candidatus Eisenbacteria bacterium]|nr:DMT family transporter [Candidatus Eisenbacteria bacterium]